MLFYVSYIPDTNKPEVVNKILDVLDESDLYAHIYMWMPHAEILYKKAITHTEDNSDLFTHKKGGVYKVVHAVNPAGNKARSHGNIIVYKDVGTGNLYYREWVDFLASMKPITGVGCE